jgi:hypothetical protein
LISLRSKRIVSLLRNLGIEGYEGAEAIGD